MIIELSEIPPEGKIFQGEESGDTLELPQEHNLRVVEPVVYDLRADLVGDELLVRGKLSIAVEFVCSRCVERFELRVTERDFTCVRDVRTESSGIDTPHEGRQDRHGQGDEPRRVDLTGEIREAILLVFPSHPVCSADCKGLCAQCGMNLNFGSCDCRPPEDRRWQALEGLVVKKGTSNGRTKEEDVEKQDP